MLWRYRRRIKLLIQQAQYSSVTPAIKISCTYRHIDKFLRWTDLSYRCPDHYKTLIDIHLLSVLNQVEYYSIFYRDTRLYKQCILVNVVYE